MALTDELREELRDKYGTEVVVVDKPQGVFAFQKPRPIAWTRYMAGLLKEDKRHSKVSDMEQLCRDCLVFPRTEADKPDFAKLASLFEEYPGIPQAVAGDLSDLAGAGESHTGKL